MEKGKALGGKEIRGESAEIVTGKQMPN